MSQDLVADGGCACRRVRYRVKRAPIVVHCCHCTWCQRETGSAFAVNALVEAANVDLVAGEVEIIPTPSQSGKGQKIARCPTCQVAVWSHYAGSGDGFCFVRVGTLDEPARMPPEIHIFTSTKQPWVTLPEGAKVFAEFYKPADQWTPDSIARFKATKR